MYTAQFMFIGLNLSLTVVYCPYLAENCKKLILIEGSIELSTIKRALVSSGPPLFSYRVSQKTWEFSDELDIVFVMN